MKKLLLIVLMFACGITVTLAQKPKEPVVSCVFTYTNVGEQNLIINQAIASCGCTVPEYTKTPIKPGEQGIIKVTYNGAGKFPGHFKKSITVRTNGAVEMTRLYVEGEMTEAK